MLDNRRTPAELESLARRYGTAQRPQRGPWVGWRRPRDSRAAWECLPASEAPTRAQCWELAVRHGEMRDVTDLDAGWEYAVVPVGEVPPAGPGPEDRGRGRRRPDSPPLSGGTYANRMMRTR